VQRTLPPKRGHDLAARRAPFAAPAPTRAGAMPAAAAVGSAAMRLRALGKTGREVSEIGFGAWQIGADWGAVDEDAAMATLRAAADAGVTFFDTADVYGDGRSERLVGRLRRERREITVATKMGRRMDQTVENYSPEHFRAWNDRSRDNVGMDTLDLVQLHCPPTDLYYHPEVFEDLDAMVAEGRIAAYGVSVERVEEALKAIEYPNVATVQIIFNPFRQRPAATFFAEAARRGVGIIVRVPLASGLLSGRYTRETTFAADDHRNFNRHGEMFDVGETFAGVPFEVGLDAVEELRPLVPQGATLAQLALRWTLMHDAVSTVIPGARSPEQAQSNAAAASLPALDDPAMARIGAVYEDRIAPHVHQRW
jgi:aryl-alcohol dehydrogenase-like predicted oxidoreductase